MPITHSACEASDEMFDASSCSGIRERQRVRVRASGGGLIIMPQVFAENTKEAPPASGKRNHPSGIHRAHCRASEPTLRESALSVTANVPEFCVRIAMGAEGGGTSRAWTRSATLRLELHACALRERMSSKGVGKRVFITLASKLLGCAVPSRTCAATVIQQRP